MYYYHDDYIDLARAIDYRDSSLIPFAEGRIQELLALVNSLDSAGGYWSDSNYIKTCETTNHCKKCQEAFLENFQIIIKNFNKRIELDATGIGYEMEERNFEMVDIPDLNVGTPNTIVNSDPNAIYEMAKAIYYYSTRLSEDMRRLANNHAEMIDDWRGKQYDQLTNIIEEMSQTVENHVEFLQDISAFVGKWAIQRGEAMGIDLEHDAQFDQRINMDI